MFCSRPTEVYSSRPEPVHVHQDVHDKDSHQTHKLLKQVKFTFDFLNPLWGQEGFGNGPEP